MLIRWRLAPIAGSIVLLCLLSSGAAAPSEEPLARLLANYLENGMPSAALAPGQPLAPLRSYPLLAVTSYLLFENDPAALARYYPDISRRVTRILEEANVESSGILRGMGGPGPGTVGSYSPGLNALGAIDLYALHLIAWKTGKYEDALECLAWANALADAVTRSFYDPSRRCFYPLDSSGRFVTTYGPGQLLPLVSDRLLGSSARGRVETDYRLRSVSQPSRRQGSPAVVDPWDDQAMQALTLDLLAAALPRDGELYQSLRAAAESAAPPPNVRQSAWTDYWRGNRFAAGRLFPPWRPVSSLVNLTLLLEREGIAAPKELAALRAGLDSVAAGLSAETLDLESYQGAIAAANRLLSRTARFNELLDQKKERWRIIDEIKWDRVSPRIRRLVREALSNAPADLLAAKADLAPRLERGAGLSFRVDLPDRPVPPGKPVDFTASLRVFRDSLVMSQVYVQIGEMRWKRTEGAASIALAPGGPPFRYEGTLPLAPDLEPGLVPVSSSIDFAMGRGRVEIHRLESVAIMKEYDVSLDLPEGRRIRETPVPLAVTLTYRPDRDVQGTVDGTFLREFVTAPALPARFVARKGTGRTDLTITVAPKGTLSPGRYPFSLTIGLDGNQVALFEDTLIRPFRWLQLGTFPESQRVLRDALQYQSDLLKTYRGTGGRPIRWVEAPAAAVDGEGAVRPQRLYGNAQDAGALLYTVVDAPARMRLSWRLETGNDASLWINSEALVAGGNGPLRSASGSVELRKGRNSFLIALRWSESPDRVSFELEDENGLPPAGLDNDLAAIVEGYAELAAPDTTTRRTVPPGDQLKGVTVRYVNASAAEVSIVGSFNNWDPAATPMKRQGSGTWTAVLRLRPGTYPYKFLVNRKQKLVDPANPATEADGFGGTNSILEVR